MSRSKLVQMVMTGLFAALIFAMAFTPYVGYIRYSPAGLEITTLHIVAILGAIVLGPLRGTIVGTVFGLSSLVYAFVFPTPAAIPFQNPLVSVLPRIFVGLAAAWCFKGMMAACSWRKISRRRAVPLAAGVAAVAGTLTNTVLVLTAYQLFGGIMNVGVILKTILMTVIGLNGVIELVAAVILVPVLAVPLLDYMERQKPSR